MLLLRPIASTTAQNDAMVVKARLAMTLFVLNSLVFKKPSHTRDAACLDRATHWNMGRISTLKRPQAWFVHAHSQSGIRPDKFTIV